MKEELFDVIKNAASIQEMHVIASAFDNNAQIMKAIFSRINGEDIPGDYDDYHNICVCFARIGDYSSACSILEKGVEVFPKNVDLLADYLEYGTKCGKQENCEKYLSLLLKIPYRLWTSRGFRFCINYLSNSFFCDDDNDEKRKQQAQDLCNEFQRYYPEEEDAYLTEYDMNCALGNREEAYKLLAKRVDEHTVMPRCCLKYCDLLLERGNYEDVIKYSAQGIMGDAQSQSGIRVGYLFYITGLARDAIIWRDNLFKNQEKVEEMYSDFQISEMLLGEQTSSYNKQIQIRTTIMSQRSGIPYKRLGKEYYDELE